MDTRDIKIDEPDCWVLVGTDIGEHRPAPYRHPCIFGVIDQEFEMCRQAIRAELSARTWDDLMAIPDVSRSAPTAGRIAQRR